MKFPPVKRVKDNTPKTYENIEKHFLKLSEVEIWRTLQVLQAHCPRRWCPSAAQLPSEVITTKDSGVTSDLELGIVRSQGKDCKTNDGCLAAK